MDNVSILALFNIVIIILSSILIAIVWKMSRLPSRYTFVIIQVLIIVLVFAYTSDLLSSSLVEKLFWNNFEYLGLIFIPAFVLVISIQLSQWKTWLNRTRLLIILGISASVFITLVTNDYHSLFYTDTALAADPSRSFVTSRGPVFYFCLVLALSELTIATILAWLSNRSSGVAQKKRSLILEFSFIAPLTTTVLGMAMETWVPSEVMVVTGIMISSVLLYVGTFGFEMFRMLPFTFDGTVRTLKDGVLIADENNKVLYSNPALPGLIDQPNEKELAGEFLVSILPNFPFELLDDKVSSENQDVLEVQLLPGRFYDIQVSKIHNRKHITISSLVIIKEVTERKRLEEEITKATRLSAIGTLAGGIAHDFNNVLTIIMGNIEIARRSGISDTNSEKWFDDMSRAMERAKDLSNQLLTFSRGGAPVKKDTPLENLVNETLTGMSDDDDVHFEIEFPEDLGNVNIDEGQIRQAFVHILKNAREAMPDGGLLNISAVRSYIDGESIFLSQGEYVHIRIRDSGKGIPASEVTHVFEPYFTTKRDHSGMGLAVAYSIIKAHNGHVSLESDTENGTTVHIYLPTLREKNQSANEPIDSFNQESSLKVLIMDDEEMIREIATEMLEMLGHTADSVYGGQEALGRYAEAMASGKPYDLVVMDLTIPNGMGGKEAIVELLKIDPNARVIVSSGYSNDPVMGDYRKFGFSHVMPKPYKIQDFETAIRQAMSHRTRPNYEMVNEREGMVADHPE